MALVTAPLLSLDASGKVAGAIVFSKWKGRNYVRSLVKPANPRSGGQVSMRSMMKYLSQQWAGMSVADQATWQARADQLIASPFNAFISVNLKRWRSFTTPTKIDPAAETGSVATAETMTATGGVRQATITTEVTGVLLDNWGTLIFKGSTGFTTSFSNLIAVNLNEVLSVVATFVDSPLVPATYFYNYRLFTDDGVIGPELGEESAVVT